MTRKLALTAGTALLAIGAALAWSAVQGEREFRRLLDAGERASAAGRSLEAVESFSGALALRPDSMVAHLKRGDAHRRRGDLEPALRDLRDAADLDPAAPQPVDLLADVNAAMGRYDRAIELYGRALSLDERSPRVLYKLALAFYRTERPEQAVERLRRALTLDDRLTEAHHLLGLCLLELGQDQQAVVALRRAIALSPGLIAAREALAEAHRAAGSRRDYLEQLEAIAALEPERPERIVSVAAAYARAGRGNASLAALDRLGDELPDDESLRVEVARTWLMVATLRSDRRLMTRARRLLNQVAERPDAAGDALALLGQAQLLQGESAAAERTLQRAVARVPVQPAAFLDLARAAELRGHPRVARSALIDFASVSIDEDERQRAALRIAELSLQLDEPSPAREWATRAIGGERPAAAGYAALARAALQLGDTDAARDAVREGLKLNARHPALTGLRRQLENP